MNPRSTVCTIKGCDALRFEGWGLCEDHYAKWQETGSTKIQASPRRMYDPVCSVEGCSKPHRAKGYCGDHLYRWNKYGDPEHAVKKRAKPEPKPKTARPATGYTPYSFDPADAERCKNLWSSVILQMLDDATATQPDAQERQRNEAQALFEQRRRLARDWLLRTNADFDTACAFADLEPNAVREGVRRVIDQKDKLQRMIAGVRGTGGGFQTFNDTTGTGVGRHKNHFEAFQTVRYATERAQ